MPTAIEIVRFEVAGERHAELISGHADARRAIRAVAPPGALWSRLLRCGERGWLEIVAWESRQVFERALELAPSDPTAGAWFSLADPGWTILTGELLAASAGAPPREGELELSWSDDGGQGSAAWSARIEIDDRAWLDPSGWVAHPPEMLTLSEVAGDATGESEPGRRELGRIAHAIDAPDERGETG